ncbi:hypothetical protein M407DRAFT_233621 [Tulasnella calospora MUT 4182]|uniref:Uncharacterized protein n=1 Tax=Tulasnella calospora MUT 4182 TaxID=1051891 RepID=A0A0C3QJA2_9AGAM|nr:hypothetical protein M407DRAFT_233621 [Tulasnella calospora MUT 4182]
MDPASHPQSSSQHHDQHLQPTAHQAALSSPIAKRKPGRPIEETDNRELELKREKARERQRRKRARDKQMLLQKGGELVAGVPMEEEPQPHNLVPASSQQPVVSQVPIPNASQPPPSLPPPPQPIPMPVQMPEPVPPPQRLAPSINLPDTQAGVLNNSSTHSVAGPSSLLVPTPEDPRPVSEEEMKREKVRRAARERQRKHRALLKAKRMSAMDDVNQLPPPPGYSHAHPQHAHHPAGHGPPHPHLLMAQEHMLYQDQVAAAALQAQAAQAQILAEARSGVLNNQMPVQQQPPQPPAANTSPVTLPAAVPAVQQIPPPEGPPGGSPGETFAGYMMLAFSCAPMLKAHVMATMGMAEGDLHAVQQLIASAWDQWNHMRHLPTHQQASSVPAQGSAEHVPFAEGSGVPSAAGPAPTPVEYFRERFQRTMAQPSPYQNQAGRPTHSSSPSPKRSRRPRGERGETMANLLRPVGDDRGDAIGESEAEDEEMRDINQTYSGMNPNAH